MVVKYCSKCSGKPYTTDLHIQNCPKCGRDLGIETVDEYELEERQQMYIPQSNDNSNYSDEQKDYNPFSNSSDSLDKTRGSKTLPVKRNNKDDVCVSQKFEKTISTVSGNTITGRVSQYSSSGKEDGEYKRFFITKLIDAVFYGQRFEDVLHRFRVRVDGGTDAFGHSIYNDVPVNVHGTIASGMQIADNSEVEVTGKYRNGVLMAKSVKIINNGYKSNINFQHSAKAIIYGMLAVFALIFLVYIGISSDGGFFDNIGAFVRAWFISFVILSILYLFLSFSKFAMLARMASGGKNKFPFIGIALAAAVLALVFMNGAGLMAGAGSFILNLIGSLMPLILIVGAIILVIKSLFK